MPAKHRDRSWLGLAEKCEPMTSNPFNACCVDLFCGVGGLTHGFISEGLPVVAGIDSDHLCRFAYEYNNKAKFIQRDITEVSVEEVTDLFLPNRFRVLAGCAPCQPFSTYSQRYEAHRDGKWSLLSEFARLVQGVEPDVVTMENVPSIERHSIFEDFIDTLKHLEYEVETEVIDCARYGVPQTRRRMVLLASRHGPIRMIEATLDRPRTVRDVIFDLEPIEAGGSASSDRLHTASSLSLKNLERIEASKPGGSWRDWPEHLIADCHKALTGRSYPSVYGRMEWDKPAPTITTQCHGYGNGRFGHPEQNRAISLREAAILQGFPLSYRFVESDEPIRFTSLARMIGNAVPVDLGRAIARSILRHLAESNPILCRSNEISEH